MHPPAAVPCPVTDFFRTGHRGILADCCRAEKLDSRGHRREEFHIVEPRAGRGVGCVEAPRGTLIHDYSTDENGLVNRANMIVGTTHNLGPINMSVHRAARDLIQGGAVSEGVLNQIEMAVRAYEP
jgi:coenzyme F420-reducing hydrogenase alpha subunit